MTTQSVTGGRSLRQVLATGIAGGVVFAAVFTAFGAFGPFAENAEFNGQNAVEWLIGVAAAIVVAAAVWMTGKAGTVPGNATGAANRALTFGILALVSFPAFWLGIYAVFAVGSLVLGGAAIRQTSGGVRTKAIVGVILAAVATVACAMANLVG